jgi:hypothetical protein
METYLASFRWFRASRISRDILTVCASNTVVQDEGKLLNLLKKRYTYQKTAGIHFADYAAHARELLLQNGEIGPSEGTAISGGAEPGGFGDNYMESPGYSSMRVAKLKQELRSRRLRSGGTKPQLLQRLLADNAKHADSQDESSDSGGGSGNNSDSE